MPVRLGNAGSSPSIENAVPAKQGVSAPLANFQEARFVI
jgi:hypothetical protein